MGIVQVGLILGGNFLWWKFSGWDLSGGNHPGGDFPGESFHVTNESHSTRRNNCKHSIQHFFELCKSVKDPL